MTRARIITRYQAPSYYEHANKLTADGVVIFGPHLDVDYDNPEALRDPLNMARRFAHAMAMELGEPYTWGWYAHPECLRPGVCASEHAAAARGYRQEGSTATCAA
jgi:hypothetical protein